MKRPRPLPDTITIGPVDYQVRVDDPYFDTNDQLGACSNPAHALILLNLEHPAAEDELVDTIWHEILHAIDDIYRIPMSERRVVQLAEAITAVMQANPQLMRFMLAHQARRGK